jgi:hypothetical protein
MASARFVHANMQSLLAWEANKLLLTIWLRFCCDCGPEEPDGGGPCCGAIAL